MPEYRGKDFIALRRLSDAADRTLAAAGKTCDRVPAAPGGTVSDALARLLASGKIVPVNAGPSSPAVLDVPQAVDHDDTPAPTTPEGEV